MEAPESSEIRIGPLQDKLGFRRPTLPGGVRLAEIAEQVTIRTELMGLLRQATPALDRKGQGAYLVNGLSFRLGEALAVSDFGGRDCGSLTPAQVQIAARVVQGIEDGEPYVAVEYDMAAPPLPHGRPSAETMNLAIEQLFCNMVEAVATDVRLSRGALWRLVSDGIAGSYLNVGRSLGCIEAAMERAEAILMRKGSPLRCRQLHFLKVDVPAADSPTGERLLDWFRVRGGCCRYYTTPPGEYCGTCVLRQDHEQWFRRHVLGRARASMASAQ